MSFGFYNAFSTFERLMEQVLDGMPWEAPLICPDDTIRVKSFSEKLRLRCCFQEAPSGRTKTESKKEPLVPEAGHVVCREGISTDLTWRQVRGLFLY